MAGSDDSDDSDPSNPSNPNSPNPPAPRAFASMDDLPPTPPLLATQIPRQPSVDVSVLAEHLPAGYTAAFDGGTAATTSEPPLPSSSSVLAPNLSSSRRPPLSVGAFDAPTTTTSSSSSPSSPDAAAVAEDSSLKLQGGDMHRHLFKLDHSARLGHRRAHTFHYPVESADPDLHGDDVDDSHDPALSVPEQLMPGGFRRQYVLQRRQTMLLRNRRRRSVVARLPVTRNFVEFLELYGSFAGEDLNDSDDEDAVVDEDDDEDAERARREGEEQEEQEEQAAAAQDATSERRPLLPRNKPSTRSLAPPRAANASVAGTFFTLLKAFIGTGIMFLPKAFYNGGLLVSTAAMLAVSAVTMLAFHLLLECKRRVVADGHGGGYGDIGAAVAGRRMRAVILGSITLSQIGFVCTGLVFVAENLAVFLKAVLPTTTNIPSIATLVLAQLAVLVPLSFIRQIAKLGYAAIVADIFILLGVGYMYWYCTGALLTSGINPTVVPFNPSGYTLMLGAVIFTFEGIGLILPIEASMAAPHRFEPLLALVMVLITLVFTSVGALCYATFGSATQTEILANFPQRSPLVNAVQLLYSLAVLFGNPVQLFPAVRILEAKVFGFHRSGRRSWRNKWRKNAFRAGLLLVCAGVAIAGSASLDRFVALIGSVACVPLVYVYPPMLHYVAVAKTPRARMVDVALMTVGVVGMFFTTTVTVWTSFL